jgi:hypothetical protein
MNSGSPPDLRQIFLSGFARKRLSRIDLHPPKASRGVSVHPARLTISGLAIDQKRAIAALGALAQVSRLDLFRLLLTCDLRGCLLA